jgi:AP-3 complex subunit mu
MKEIQQRQQYSHLLTMMQSLFLLSPTGEVLIERHFRDVTSRGVCDYFWERASATVNHHGGLATTSTIIDYADSFHDTVPPVMEVPSADKTLYLFSILRDGLSYLAVCPAEVSPLLVLEFLHRVADIFADYFGTPTDESAIKDNFSTVYQLLEEMVDYGWPLTTEPNALKAMIRPPSVMAKLQSVVTGGSNAIVSDALPSGTVSNMPWRAAGVKYSQNEIYIDIVEEIDAIIDASGNVVSSDVSGSIQAQSHLSGVPDLLLTFKEPDIIEDCSFHPCVRYSRFEADKVVSFVPPDGDFELMRYRVRSGTVQGFHPPIYVNPQWSFSNDSAGLSGRVTLTVGVRSISSLILSASRKGPMIVEEVSLTMPLPKSVKTANINVSVGTVLYDEAAKIAKWTLGKLDTTKKPQLQASLQMEGKKKPESNPNLFVEWKIPLASVSGLSVSGLSVMGETYRPYKGVRNITKSGRFMVRGS